MSPRMFATGLSLTFVLALVFYSWILYRVFGAPGKWVLAIVAQVAIALMLIGISGYRRWHSQRHGAVRQTELDRKKVGLYLAAVAVPTFCATYLQSQGLMVATLAAGLVAAAVAGLSRLQKVQPLTEAPDFGPLPPANQEWSHNPSLFRAYMVGVNAMIPFILAVIFFVQHEVVLALLLLGLFAAVLPYAVRGIRREFRRDAQ